MIDITVPTIGESINEATISKWVKQDGDYVQRDEVICELESEKASFELNAEQAGILKIKAAEGDTVEIGQVIGTIDEKAEAAPGNREEKKKEKKEAPATDKAAAAEEKAPGEAAPEKKGENRGVIEIKVPAVGESISEVTLLSWKKQSGTYVARDEVICELESEKATFELNAEQAGTLEQAASEGDTLKIGDVVAKIDTAAEAPAGASAAEEKPQEKEAEEKPFAHVHDRITVEKPESVQPEAKATPVAAAMMVEKKVNPAEVHGSGARGKIIKNDVLAALEHPGTAPGKPLFGRGERREKMSNLRKTISRRLVEAKNGTAMLTTFNEADMGAIMEIRKQYKEKFKE